MYKFVVEHHPNLMFIHFDSIDDAGHSYSWGSPEYYNAVKVKCITHVVQQSVDVDILLSIQNVDSYIGLIMKAFEEEGIYDKTLFILTADHEG